MVTGTQRGLAVGQNDTRQGPDCCKPHSSSRSETAQEFMFLKALDYSTLNPDKQIPTY